MTLGAFTLLFMLVSLFIKDKLYLGEAPIATLFGVIIGPHATNLLDPRSWPNHEQTIIEFSRVVLVVQCFVVGLELPKHYVERHWRSLFFLLGPVMVWGWLISSFFIWLMIDSLTWVECLLCGACFNATDPLLAAAAFGKSKFSKKIPLHLRTIILAESASNDAMAAPVLGLTLYLLLHLHAPKEVLVHWILITVLYECVFGAVLGVIIGLIGRGAIKFADRRDMMDRNSFLVFYFVLALFSAGVGSLLGVDEVLTGFFAGIAFDNDDWFSEKTEESNISNVINLLLNLSFFIYLGAIIPWEMYHDSDLGLTPWRLVVISLSIFLFRRIPIMLVLKPWIPDVMTWRESLLAGYFGPIGGGAVFAALLVQDALGGSMKNPDKASIVKLIWPITTFVVVCSIFLHGSSIAVWAFGRRVNTLTVTLTYTLSHDDEPLWMYRLPRIQTNDKLGDRPRKWPVRPSNIGPLRLEDPVFNNGQQTVIESDDLKGPKNTPSDRFSTLDGSPRVHGKAKPFTFFTALRKNKGNEKDISPIDQRPVKKRGPAHAYQVGNTIIVEDDDGKVIKSYTIPPSAERELGDRTKTRFGFSSRSGDERGGSQSPPAAGSSKREQDRDEGVDHQSIARSRRMSKGGFIKRLRQLDSEARFEEIGEKATVDSHGYNDTITHGPAPQFSEHRPETSIMGLETAVELRRRLAALGASSDSNDSDSDDNGEPRMTGANGSDARPATSHPT
jgi:sodium/hydrogen antiporter